MTSKTRSTTKTPQRSTTGNASASRRDDARKPVVTLYGNVGGNPETKTIPGQQITKPYYDPITDEVVDREEPQRIARCGPSPSPSTTRRRVGREALEPRRRLEGPFEDGPEGRSPAGHALLPRAP